MNENGMLIGRPYEDQRILTDDRPACEVCGWPEGLQEYEGRTYCSYDLSTVIIEDLDCLKAGEEYAKRSKKAFLEYLVSCLEDSVDSKELEDVFWDAFFSSSDALKSRILKGFCYEDGDKRDYAEFLMNGHQTPEVRDTSERKEIIRSPWHVDHQQATEKSEK